MRLSGRKLKAFDRRGGAYLVLPWPADLPPGGDAGMEPGDERAASSREHIAAMRIVGPIAQQHGLIHLATQVLVFCEPVGSAARPWLMAHLVTPRWQRTTEPGEKAKIKWPDMPVRSHQQIADTGASPKRGNPERP